MDNRVFDPVGTYEFGPYVVHVSGIAIELVDTNTGSSIVLQGDDWCEFVRDLELLLDSEQAGNDYVQQYFDCVGV